MAAIGVATIAASFLYAPWVSNGPVLCPFRFLTGLPCPGCGLTRSFCAVARGEFADAVAYHLFGPVLFAILLPGIVLLLVEGLTRHRIRVVNSVLFSTRGAYVAGGLLAAFHLARLIAMAWSGTLLAGITSSHFVVLLHHIWG
jgi:hypothetical protein